MSLFDGPEYASFIALCRELRLEHDLREGDYYGQFYSGEAVANPWDERVRIPEGAWWIPRLDQWLAILVELKVYAIELNSDYGAPGSGHEIAACAEVRGNLMVGYGHTREEAAARLYCAVTGRAVTA